jgi:acetyl esterase/lipase
LLNTHSTDPYPFAVDEIFDAYRIIVESKGKAIGIDGEDVNIVLSGDSAYV